MTVLLIIAGIVGVSTIIVLAAALSAPEGFQDEEGFHYRPEGEPHRRHPERVRRRQPVARH